jgi:hypothetical protein
MLPSWSSMPRHTKSGPPSLSRAQQSVADALGSGATISGAAEELEVSRVTIYHWIKTRKDFAAAIQQARAEFVFSRRDDLQYLSDRALESVIAILDDPSTPSGVRLRAAMLILRRPQPKTGWCMPEPVPEPGREKLFDSVLLEHDYDSLPCLQDPAAGAPASADPEPPPPSPPSESTAGPTDFTKSYTFTRNSGVNPPAHRQTGLQSCPVPPAVAEARDNTCPALRIWSSSKPRNGRLEFWMVSCAPIGNRRMPGRLTIDPQDTILPHNQIDPPPKKESTS